MFPHNHDLNMKLAVFRAPGTLVQNAAGLTQVEALSFFDLASHWSRIDKTEDEDQEYREVSELLPTFLNEVFVGWDSRLGPPCVPRLPRLQISVRIGKWEADLGIGGQSGDANVMVAMVGEPANLRFSFRTSYQRIIPGGEDAVTYDPGMSFQVARAQCISNYNMVERSRVNRFNRVLLLNLARRRVTKFVQSSNMGNDGGNLEVAPKDHIRDRFVVLRLAQ